MKKIVTNINEGIYLKSENTKLKKIKDYIENNVIIVYKDKVINKWEGMGGAVSESVAYNYSKLNDEKKKLFLNDIYSNDGLDYNYTRISIGSCDFSLSSYEYTSKKDLSDFSLERDKEYIIPMLKDIYSLKKVNLIAVPWSAPSFMKDNKNLLKGGKLKKKYYNLYARYLHEFINKYEKLGFKINYINMQNEPMVKQKWESCTFSLQEQQNFIYNYLINEIKDIKVILWEHNRENILNVMNFLYQENDSVKYLGVHWYSGKFYNNLRLVHEKYPDVKIINTEMCCGYSPYNEIEWINDAKIYLKDIISCMNNCVSAYLDWNILLDYYGGPNHKENYCKSAIILNEEEQDYIKTPIYYYIAHIAKYIKKGYEIIATDKYDENLYVVAAKKDDNVIITILNDSNENIEYNLLIENEYLSDSINSNSVITYLI